MTGAELRQRVACAVCNSWVSVRGNVRKALCADCKQRRPANRRLWVVAHDPVPFHEGGFTPGVAEFASYQVRAGLKVAAFTVGLILRHVETGQRLQVRDRLSRDGVPLRLDTWWIEGRQWRKPYYFHSRVPFADREHPAEGV